MNKFIAESGFTSRRKAEEYIEQGRVLLNGKVVKTLSTKVDPLNDVVYVDDVKLKKKEKVYYLLNKPKGVITSTDDERKRKTVVDLIDTREKIFPVGRLDYNTTGILLLTNDGDFSNQLTHPSYKVDRVYIAQLDRDLKESDKNKLLTGVYIDRKRSMFTKISFVEEKNFSLVKVVTVEGRNHFVKNMFSSLGYKVRELQRESFGKFNTKGIPSGNYKILTKREIEKLIK
ncbi:MAG: rRNA pseudouridine synthase [Melioribacteraceae bacterium]|nr:rRNA pseudouridine synthase [Melioribacteraceae bacterium]